jgi:DNA-binding protein HU-beta
MNKAELVEIVAKEAGISKAFAEKAVNSFTGAVTTSLKKGEPVTLIGFGTFSVAQRAARTGRNPATGAPLKIKAKKLAKFKAGKTLSEIVAKAKTTK